MHQLCSAVAACQRDFDQLEAVYRRQKVGEVDVQLSRISLLGNKTRLAILEEKPGAVREHLGALIAALEWYLKVVKEEPLVTEMAITSIQAQIAFERLRLALASDPSISLREILDNPSAELD